MRSRPVGDLFPLPQPSSLSRRARVPDGCHTKYGLYQDDDLNTEPILRFEYIRDLEEYPEAHFHVRAESSDFDTLSSRAGQKEHASLDRLHLPVGGKRFRPVLEDLIEFLLRERLVEAREGWEKIFAEHREGWHRKQLSVESYHHPVAAQEGIDRWRRNDPEG